IIENRVSELAIVDSSDDETDTVVTVPRWMLQREKQMISDPQLPFDLLPLQYLANAKIQPANPKTNLATAGAGTVHQAVDVGEVSGVAEQQTVDTPAVYVELIDKKTGQSLGVYLFSLLLKEQEITIDGKTYEVSLRFRQTQRPFSLTLKKFTFDRYPGTDTPLNFASLVHLRDPERGDDREVLIRMNEPLRHRGETFYQADWNKETERGTVLQVVRNPAWQLPYWSCAIVTLGLLYHFFYSLAEFLKRRVL
ncbi:MAG: cytochrome c biogenesis protein ResB, partial [Gemmataceae bacterium]